MGALLGLAAVHDTIALPVSLVEMGDVTLQGAHRTTGQAEQQACNKNSVWGHPQQGL